MPTNKQENINDKKESSVFFLIKNITTVENSPSQIKNIIIRRKKERKKKVSQINSSF